MSKKKKSKDKTLFVYLIKFSSVKGADKQERFYKLGWSNNVNRRMKELSCKEYRLDLIETIELPADEAKRTEKTLLYDWFKYKYYPKHKPSSSKEYLQNKIFLRADNVLAIHYEAINTPEERIRYYQEKEERKEAAKQKYFDDMGWN